MDCLVNEFPDHCETENSKIRHVIHKLEMKIRLMSVIWYVEYLQNVYNEYSYEDIFCG